MGKRLQKWSNNLVNVFLAILVGFSLMGAIDTLTSSFFNLSSLGIEITMVIILILSLILMINQKYKKLVITFIIQHIKGLLLTMVLFTIFWQIYLAMSLVSTSVWEPSGMLERVMDVPNMSFPSDAYFSNMPNNFLFFLMEKCLWIIFFRPNLEIFTLILSFLNIILLDISIFLMCHSLKRIFNEKVAFMFLMFSTLLIGVSPWITIPYTDILGFVLSSVSFYVAIRLYDSTKLLVKVLNSIIMGLLMFLSYYLKASLIIFYIAGLIVWIIAMCRGNKKIELHSALIAFLTCMILSFIFSVYSNNNSLVEIDKTKAFPTMHYAAIGIKGRGSYNTEDAKADRAIKDPKKRQERDKNVFIQRLKAFGSVGNYVRFLGRKQMYNSADGTFAWAYEGYTKILRPKKNNVAQDLYFKEGYAQKEERKSAFTFPIQVIWISLLILIVFTLSNSSLSVQLLKFTVVGFFVFLLLFEGGRSRYLIQFLPFIISLGSVGMDSLASKWYRKRK